MQNFDFEWCKVALDSGRMLDVRSNAIALESGKKIQLSASNDGNDTDDGKDDHGSSLRRRSSRRRSADDVEPGEGRRATCRARPNPIFGIAEARELSRLEAAQDLVATRGTQVTKNTRSSFVFW